MKKILQALKDELYYPIPEGFIENKLIERGLDSDIEITPDLLKSYEFRGALADCLYSLIEAPNFSESDISISIADRNLILKKANLIYTSIGEETKDLLEPKVYIGQ